MAACRLKIVVVPRASRNAVAGFLGDELKIQLTAPPVEGAANAALVKFLAGLLKLPAGRLSLIAGQSGRHKILQIEGWDEAELKARLDWRHLSCELNSKRKRP